VITDYFRACEHWVVRSGRVLVRAGADRGWEGQASSWLGHGNVTPPAQRPRPSAAATTVTSRGSHGVPQASRCPDCRPRALHERLAFASRAPGPTSSMIVSTHGRPRRLVALAGGGGGRGELAVSRGGQRRQELPVPAMGAWPRLTGMAGCGAVHGWPLVRHAALRTRSAGRPLARTSGGPCGGG
jgi:hypothetical protein